MSKVALLPRPAHAAAAETPILAVSDLTVSGDEPRILDLTIAGRLGFVRPADIRELINRNRGELQSYGQVIRTARKTPSPRGGRPSFQYHLNEGQALLICALARTTMAARIRRKLITVFMDYRRGTLPAPVPAAPVVSLPDFSEAIALARRLGDALEVAMGGQGSPPAPECAPEVALPPPTPVAPPTASPADLLWGVPAIARHLGLRTRQAEHLKEKHGLPAFKIGKTVCAKAADLDAWLASRALAGEVRP